MVPKKEWVMEWLDKREKLEAHIDFDRYFLNDAPKVIRTGLCPVPCGEILVRDPMNYLENREEHPYFVTAPVGKYPLELALEETESGEVFCAAAQLIFNYRPAARYEQALIGEEDMAGFRGGYFGFFADSGWCCICDEQVHRCFCDFIESWRQENPSEDFYEYFFGELSDELYINWDIPGTRFTLPMFRAGIGAGQYPVYWGIDEEGRICRLVVWCAESVADEIMDDGEESSYYIKEEDMPEDMVWYDGYYEGEIRLREWQSFFGMEEKTSLMVYAQELSDEEVLDSCERLLADQYRLLDIMLTALMDRYPLMQLEYGHTMSENSADMPNIADRNDFCNLLSPERIVYDPQENTVAAAFSCKWDREEGFGIKIQGEKLVEIGSAAIVPDFHKDEE